MRKLGRIPSRHDPRTIRFARYLEVGRLPAAPPARDWSHPVLAPTWGMFGNDQEGDCAEAAIGHVIQATSAIVGRPAMVRRRDVEDAYSAITGWDPARPETDRGTQMLDALRYWRETGIAGERIEAFASVNPGGVYIEAALNLCGPLYAGLDLPLAAQDQTVWDVAPVNGHGPVYAAGSWGGHAAALVAYDRLHVVFVTWGDLKVATREWFMTYCSELYAVVGPLWSLDSGMTPAGFDAAALRADLALLA